jgi:transposase-like protein
MEREQIEQMTEADARTYFEKIRWPDGPICPHCRGANVAKLNGQSTRPGVFKCRNRICRKQFTVTVGTVFADTRLPLKTWLHMLFLLCFGGWRVSAHLLHRRLGVTYKSARHVCERIHSAAFVMRYCRSPWRACCHAQSRQREPMMTSPQCGVEDSGRLSWTRSKRCWNRAAERARGGR